MRNVARIGLCVFHFISILFFALACNSRMLFYYSWNIKEDLHLFGLGVIILCVHYCFLFLGMKKAFWNNATLTALTIIECTLFGLLLLLICLYFFLGVIGIFGISLELFLPVLIAAACFLVCRFACTHVVQRKDKGNKDPLCGKTKD